MERMRVFSVLIPAVLLRSLSAQQAKAQQCVNWSVYSCKDYAPSAKVLANPEDRFPLGLPLHQRTHIIGQREARHMHVGAPSGGFRQKSRL